MKCCVFSFSPRTGTGTQTIPDIVDAIDRQPFVPTLVLWQSAYAAANVATAPNWPDDIYLDSRGADTGTTRVGRVVASGDFGFKVLSGGESVGEYSLVDYTAQLSFGGYFTRLAKITAMGLGSIELTYAQNDHTGDVVLGVAFGGDDLLLAYPNSLLNGVQAIGFEAKGVLTIPTGAIGASGFTAGGTGGQNVGWGWDTPAGNAGAFGGNIGLFGGNCRQQRTDQMAVSMDTSGVAATGTPRVSVWGATNITIAGNPANAFNSTPIVFGGTGILTAAGSIIQPLATGLQSFNTTIVARWLKMGSIGTAANPAVQTDAASWTFGWTDGVTQVGFWTAETEAGFVPQKGARYLSVGTFLRFGTPNLAATTFGAVAKVVNIVEDVVTLNWLSVDGVAREILWYAVGAEVTPPTPPATPRQGCAIVSFGYVGQDITSQGVG